MNAAPLPERTVLGVYEIRSVLGRGGGGVSYRAYDSQLERAVVLKEHLPHGLCTRLPGMADVQALDAERYACSLDHFCREARILAGLCHPGVVQVHDIFMALDTAYMVMDYVEGQSLADWLPEHVQECERVEGVLQRLLEVLDYIHRCGV
ncbi:MAG: protein kinase, partial [Akkermansia sp.]|nr:protein kinase [Akkermansia sp.]